MAISTFEIKIWGQKNYVPKRTVFVNPVTNSDLNDLKCCISEECLRAFHVVIQSLYIGQLLNDSYM